MSESTLEILIKAQDDATKVIKALQKQVIKLEKELKKIGSSKGGAKVDADMKKSAKSTSGAAKETKKLNKEVKATYTSYRNLSRAGIPALEKLRKSTEKARGPTRALRKSVGGLAGQLFGLIGPAGGAAAAIAAIGFASVAFIRKANAFSAAIDEVSTLIDTNRVSTVALSEAVRGLSNEYGTDKVDTAKALYQAISAGAEEGEEANQLLAVAIKTAIGGVTEVSVAVDGLTTILNAFGLETDRATEVSDSMFVAMKGGKTTIGELSGFLFQAAGAAASLSVPYKELLAYVTALTKQGVRTAQAFTQVRAVLTGLLRPKAAEYLKALGYESAKAAIEAKGLSGVINELYDAVGGDQSKLLELVGSVEALGAINFTTGDSAHFLTAAMLDQANAAGAAEEATTKMLEGTSKRYGVAAGKIADLGLSMGTALADLFLPVVESLAYIAEEITSFGDDLDTLVWSAGDAGGEFAGLVSVLGEFNAQMGEATKNTLSTEEALQLLTGTGAFSFTTWLHKLAEAKRANRDLRGTLYRLTEDTRKYQKAVEDIPTDGLELPEVQARQAQLANIASEITNIQQQAAKLQEQGILSDEFDELPQQLADELVVVGLEVADLSARMTELTAKEKAQAITTKEVTLTQEEYEAAVQEATKATTAAVQAAAEYTRVLEAMANTQASVSLAEVAAVFAASTQAAKRTGDLTGGVQALQTYAAQVVRIERERMEAVVAIKEEERSRVKALIVHSASTEGQKDAQLAKLDAKHLGDRLKARQVYYAALGSLQQGALQAQMGYLNKVAQLNKEIASTKVDDQYSERDTYRSGLSDYKAYLDRKKELTELYLGQLAALSRGDYEQAKQLNDRRLQLAEELGASEVKSADSGRVIVSQAQAAKEAEEERKRILASRVTLLQRERDTYQDLADKAARVAKEAKKEQEIQLKMIQKLSQDRAAKVEVSFDVQSDALDGYLDEIERGVEIPVTFKKQGGPVSTQGFASGGFIRGAGTGTSDSILARLSNGEYVMDAKTTKMYGPEFFAGLQRSARKSMPAPSGGGGYSSGGSVQGGQQVGYITLNLGDTEYSLYTDHQQAKAIVQAFKNVNRE